MSEWQPIETAPKDGGPVLLWFPWGKTVDSDTGFNGIRFIGLWSSDGDGGPVCWRDPEDFEALGDNATHWMPLPAPPEAPTP